ncbi:MAG: sulfatase-like hydrolase/transferase [Planctomycetota bacterium]
MILGRYRLSRVTTVFLSTMCLLWPCRTGFGTQPALDSAQSTSTRPNVLIIFTDDQGIHDVGCYGSEIPTPHIDSIARRGVRFTSWYSASSICTPSRFGLLTGRNPSRSSDSLLGALMFMGEEDADRGIRPSEMTLATMLQGAGYHTALLGKWHLGHGDPKFLPTRHGFRLFRGHTGGCIDYFTMTYGNLPDWYFNERHDAASGYATDLITDHAVEYLQRDHPSPFFLMLSYNAPHFAKGWSPSEGRPVNIMQPKAPEMKRVAFIDDKVRREFAAMTVALDDGIGRVLSAISDEDLADDTLVLFITDHGGDPVYGGSNQPLRGDKATLFEGGIRVPAIACWPGKIAAGFECDDVLSSLDVFPTVCRLAGIDVADQECDGIDFSPVFTMDVNSASPVSQRERSLVWELGSHSRLNRQPWKAIRRGNWKFVQDNRGNEFLFDLANDPNESVDLRIMHSDIFGDLRRECFQRLRSMRSTTAE